MRQPGYDKLTLEVWTDTTPSPRAMRCLGRQDPVRPLLACFTDLSDNLGGKSPWWKGAGFQDKMQS